MRKEILTKGFIQQEDLDKLGLTFVGYEAGSAHWCNVYKDDNNILYVLNKGDKMGGQADYLEVLDIGETVEIEQ